MRRKLVLVTILSLMMSPLAFAGRGHGHGGGKHNRVVVRDHRGPSGPGRPHVRDHRHGGARVKHVRVTNGRYVFPGGVVRVYQRPVMRVKYRDRHVRPAIIVEQYDPVPGYVWVRGNWSWGGAEWVWVPGYWSVAAEPVYVEPAPAPVISGGVSVSAGVSIH
jgi:hypothetical protein